MGSEFQPVWLIANDPEITIDCKGAGTLTYFAKEATSVASGEKIPNSALRIPLASDRFVLVKA
ncbi:MAG: hypothetical protein ACRD3E_14395 [Terriglobales bacterium]